MKQSINNQQSRREKIRKPYLKPQLSRVNLVAKEAVLASGCKTASGPNASGATVACDPGGPVAVCREFGS